MEEEALLTGTEARFYIMPEKLGKIVFPEAMPFPSVVFLKDHGEKKVVYRTVFAKKQYKQALKDFAIPNLAQLKPKYLDTITKDLTKKGIILLCNATDKTTLNNFRQFRKAFPSKEYIFLYVHPGDETLEYLGLANLTKATLLTLTKENEELKRYKYNETMGAKEMQEFVEKWRMGKAIRDIRSEEEPFINPGPVYKLVSKAFERDVLNSTLNVVVKYYAPWCPHCKEMAPSYIEVAKMFPQIKFMEVDGTKNDIEGFPSDGYPTIRLFPRDQAKRKKMSGAPTKENLIKFIQTEFGMSPMAMNIPVTPLNITEKASPVNKSDERIKIDL